MNQGIIRAISVSEKKGIAKVNVDRAELRAEHGIVDDAHAGPGIRQVSLLADESVDKLRSKMPELKAGDFAENITTQGIDLVALPLGTRLALGSKAVLEMTQIGKECHSRCHIYDTVGDCVMPREGVFGVVVSGGAIRPGDKLRVIEEDGDDS